MMQRKLYELHGDFCFASICYFILDVNHVIQEKVQVFVFYFCPFLNLLLYIFPLFFILYSYTALFLWGKSFLSTQHNTFFSCTNNVL